MSNDFIYLWFWFKIPSIDRSICMQCVCISKCSIHHALIIYTFHVRPRKV
ncbi:hypothetical protein KC19_6G026100 [Ceratodon purpureus]|uniref:Uncharacterized protein n=1 Tax=Ceratodon purpureus TaxID=3225 RepID=A0A8T0HB77_CERPU|nr:hypothetical protein KC19_6G026100 [Ceratodon purpureus]